MTSYSITATHKSSAHPNYVVKTITEALQKAGVTDVRILPIQRKHFEVVVPKPEFGNFGIQKGSGIVGIWDGEDYDLYYEGAFHGQEMTFEEKLFHAASRMVTRYPTTARMAGPTECFTVVGCFSFNDDWSDEKLVVTDQEALDVWRNQS